MHCSFSAGCLLSTFLILRLVLPVFALHRLESVVGRHTWLLLVVALYVPDLLHRLRSPVLWSFTMLTSRLTLKIFPGCLTVLNCGATTTALIKA